MIKCNKTDCLANQEGICLNESIELEQVNEYTLECLDMVTRKEIQTMEELRERFL
jgi:hypothetical protein